MPDLGLSSFSFLVFFSPFAAVLKRLEFKSSAVVCVASLGREPMSRAKGPSDNPGLDSKHGVVSPIGTRRWRTLFVTF